jgi:hypothetical protein
VFTICNGLLFTATPGMHVRSHIFVTDGQKASVFLYGSFWLTNGEYIQKLKLSHEGVWGERRYSSYSFSTSALDGGEYSVSRPGHAITSEKGPPVPTG